MKLTSKNLKAEAIGGITTFVTMAYIVIVNPSILATEGTGMPFDGVLTATVLLTFLMTLFMGVYAKLPFAVAPGMGINAFFTYSVILSRQVPWQTALGMVFWAGFLFILISVTPLRTRIANSIPKELRVASAVGIGIFLTFIGLRNSGIIVADPATLVKLGHLDQKSILSLFGLAIMTLLLNRKSPFAFLVGIVFVSTSAIALGYVKLPTQLLRIPDFRSTFFKLDLIGSLKLSLLPTIFSIMLTDLFDSISTFVGVSHATGLLDKKGQPRNLKEGLVVDAFATVFAGLFGTSSGTAYLESASGIEAGGRTGWTAVFTALCFLPCFFLSPLAGSVPSYATAPVLILIGALMFKNVSELKIEKLEDALPAFLTIVLIPLTFSITQGLLWGFISHVVLYTINGRRKEIAPMMFFIAALAVALLFFEN